MLGVLASIVLSAASAAQPAVPADPCYDAYKAAIKAANQFESDCLSAPLPGPVPCMDWPECCSQEAQRMRDQALIDLLRCWGWIPLAPEGN